MAASSDSTLVSSHGASSPVFTSWESASTMCVWGEIGYAAMTSGRQAATASATAREPSICLDMARLPDERERRLGRLHVALGRRGREALADRGGHRIERHDAGDGGERPEQRRVGQRLT